MNSLYNHPLIHIKDKKSFEKKITDFRLNKLQIVADFDNTITQDNGETSWSLFPKSGLMPDEYVAEEAALFDHYYPLEIDANLNHKDKDALMKEWWLAALELFVKYRLHIDIIDEIIEDECAIDFRDGMAEFLELAAIKNIPLIILSAGLTNTINEFLNYTGSQFHNIHVVSNELKFDTDGYCVGINKDLIMHSENKDEHDMPENIRKMIEGKTDIMLLGDSLSDVKMIDENLRSGALKIGFLAEKKKASMNKFMECFDIVIEDNYDSLGVPEMILDMIK